MGTWSLAAQRLLLVEAMPSRRENFRLLVERILAADCLTPSVAASLLGKFGFLCSTLFGKIGRCCAAAIRDRQYSVSSNTALTPTIRQSLWLMTHLVSTSPPRHFHFGESRPPLLLYTDASDVPERDERFVVGGVLVETEHGLRLEYFSWSVPLDVVRTWLPKQSYMGQLEIFAGRSAPEPTSICSWSSTRPTGA